MKKNQHYVPRFYLKTFCEDEKLFACDMQNKRFVHISPQNICVKKNIYETQAEGAFGKTYIQYNAIEDIYSEYEYHYSILLKRLFSVCKENNRDALILQGNEKHELCRFLINMLIRNPRFMKSIEIDIVPEEIKATEFYQNVCTVTKELKIGNADPMFRAAIKKSLLTYKYNDSEENPFVKVLSELNYCFFVAEKGEFLTSDAPAFYGNDLSIVSENSTCLYMALSPRVAVLFGNYKNSKSMRNRMIPISEDVVNKFNHSIVGKKQYYRWLIARSKSAIEKALKE